MSYLKQIRKRCKEFCMNGYHEELVNCTSPSCALFTYRMGKTPKMVESYKKRQTSKQKQSVESKSEEV